MAKARLNQEEKGRGWNGRLVTIEDRHQIKAKEGIPQQLKTETW